MQAEITETNEIASIFEHINEQSLVLFNVTGVLYEPSITLCDKQWRDYFDKRVQAIAADQANAERFINRIKNEIVNNIPKKCLEKNTPELIRRLQADGIKVLGITKKNLSNSYSQNFGQITNKHLLSLGIDLEKTLDYLSLKEPNEEDSFTFRYGLIFTNKHPEGPALVEIGRAHV